MRQVREGSQTNDNDQRESLPPLISWPLQLRPHCCEQPHSEGGALQTPPSEPSLLQAPARCTWLP